MKMSNKCFRFSWLNNNFVKVNNWLPGQSSRSNRKSTPLISLISTGHLSSNQTSITHSTSTRIFQSSVQSNPMFGWIRFPRKQMFDILPESSPRNPCRVPGIVLFTEIVSETNQNIVAVERLEVLVNQLQNRYEFVQNLTRKMQPDSWNRFSYSTTKKHVQALRYLRISKRNKLNESPQKR